MRVLVTRPKTDSDILQTRLEALDHEVMIEPLLTLSFDQTDPVDLAGVQAVIATSKNAIRGLAAQGAVELAAKLPLFAVGPGTATEARALGFELILVGKGGARDLVAKIVGTLDPHAGPLLHAAGDVLAFDLAHELRQHGFSLDQPVVYRMQPIARLSRLILAEIGTGELDAVMLLSPRTAEIWVQLVSKIGLQKEAARLLHLCLSPAIAQRLTPLGPTRIEIAKHPTLDDLLALVS